MEFKNENLYTDILKLVLASTLLGVVGFYFGGLLLVFFPFLFMESSIKNGVIPTMIAMLVSSLILSIFSSLLAGLSLFFIFAPMVLIFQYGVTSKKSYQIILLLMILVLLISSISLQLGVTPLGSINLETMMEDFVNNSIKDLGENLSNLELSRLEESLRDAFMLSLSLLPGMYFIMVSVVAYINYTFAGRNLLKKGILITQPPLFRNFQVPRVTIILVAISLGITILLRAFNVPWYDKVYMNIIVVFGFIYLINGLATFTYFLARFRIPLFVIILIGVLMAFYLYTLIVFIILGLIDSILYLRQMNLKRE